MENTKTETKHTKGPWKVIDGWDKNGNGRFFPSVVIVEGAQDNRGQITINVSHDKEIESLMANAELIARAPELLEENTRLSSKLREMEAENERLKANNKLLNDQIIPATGKIFKLKALNKELVAALTGMTDNYETPSKGTASNHWYAKSVSLLSKAKQ